METALSIRTVAVVLLLLFLLLAEVDFVGKDEIRAVVKEPAQHLEAQPKEFDPSSFRMAWRSRATSNTALVNALKGRIICSLVTLLSFC